MQAALPSTAAPRDNPATHPVDPPDSGKVVLISYAFPPDNTSGAVRVGKFVHHLALHYGWSLDVVTPIRKSMAQQCPANPMAFTDSVSVRATRNFELFDFVARVRGSRRRSNQPAAPLRRGAMNEPTKNQPTEKRIRSIAAVLSDLMAVPDTRTGWIFWAIREALRCIERSHSQTVLFSSGPPHSAHVAAAVVKYVTARPWVVDLRDPWSSNPYSAVTSGPAERWNRVLERIVLGHADAIICNTSAARQLVRQRFPKLADDRILTVPNGFDPEDFDDIVPRAFWPAQTRPVLMHAGSIYGARVPFALLEALGALYAQDPVGCPKLVFLGEWDAELRQQAERLIDRLNLSDSIIMRASMPRKDAIAAQAAADGLILLGDSSLTGVQIPGKLFEYLRLQKPLLSLFASGSPVESYVQRYAAVHASAAPNDAVAIASALHHLCARMNQPRSPSAPIEELSRGHQVTLVHRLLKDVLR